MKKAKPHPGICYYDTTDGVRVARLHWSADDTKNVTGSNGPRWLETTSKGWTGGVEGADWQQEYEINFKIESGLKVWPNFDRTHYPYVTYDPDPEINPFAPSVSDMQNWPIWAGMDWGTTNPCVFTIHAMQSKERAYMIDEIVTKGETPRSVAQILKDKWYYQNIVGYVGDPSIWRKAPSDRAPKSGERQLWTSVGKMFQEEGIYIQKGSNEIGVDKLFVTLLNNNLWHSMAAPKWLINKNCVHTIDELRNLRWIENTTESQKENNPDPEKIHSKKVDAFDSCKYLLMSKDFEAPGDLSAPAQSFDWYMERMMRDDEEGMSMFS